VGDLFIFAGRLPGYWFPVTPSLFFCWSKGPILSFRFWFVVVPANTLNWDGVFPSNFLLFSKVSNWGNFPFSVDFCFRLVWAAYGVQEKPAFFRKSRFKTLSDYLLFGLPQVPHVCSLDPLPFLRFFFDASAPQTKKTTQHLFSWIGTSAASSYPLDPLSYFFAYPPLTQWFSPFSTKVGKSCFPGFLFFFLLKRGLRCIFCLCQPAGRKYLVGFLSSIACPIQPPV